MRFSLRQLEVFTAIGGTGNVTHAAEKLGMSQSAASTALAELERQFGHPLFDRFGKRVRLNEIGRAAMPKALELLDRAVEMEGLLSGRGTPGILHLGASLTIGNYLCPQLIERYRKRYPGAGVKLEIGNTSRIAARIAEYDLDMALIEGQTTRVDLIVKDWVGDELAIFCGPQHPLSRAYNVEIDQLLAEDWVVREPGSGTRQALDNAMSPFWDRWKIAIELEHTEAIKTAVGAGSGIGCLSRLALEDAFESGSLVEIRTHALRLSRRFYFLFNRQKYRTRGMDAFTGICGEFAVRDSVAARSR